MAERSLVRSFFLDSFGRTEAERILEGLRTGTAPMREAYPGATWERLAAVKARYDPGNLFRLNQNVPPAPGAA